MVSDVCTCMLVVVLIVVVIALAYMLLHKETSEPAKIKGGGTYGNTFRIDRSIGCQLFSWKDVDKLFTSTDHKKIENTLVTYINEELLKYCNVPSIPSIDGGGLDELDKEINSLREQISENESIVKDYEDALRKTGINDERKKRYTRELNTMKETLDSLKKQLNELLQQQQQQQKQQQQQQQQQQQELQAVLSKKVDAVVQENSEQPQPESEQPLTEQRSVLKVIPNRQPVDVKQLDTRDTLHNNMALPTIQRNNKVINMQQFKANRTAILRNEAIQNELLECASNNTATIAAIRGYVGDDGCKLMALLSVMCKYRDETLNAFANATNNMNVTDLRINDHTSVGYINYMLAYYVFTDEVNQANNKHIVDIYYNVLGTVYYMETNRVPYDIAYCQYLHKDTKNPDTLTPEALLKIMHRLSVCIDMLDPEATKLLEHYTTSQFDPIRGSLDQSNHVATILLDYIRSDQNGQGLSNSIGEAIGNYDIEQLRKVSPYMGYEFVSTSMYFPVLENIKKIVNTPDEGGAVTNTVVELLGQINIHAPTEGVDIAQCYNNNINSPHDLMEFNCRQWIYGFVKGQSQDSISELQRLMTIKSATAETVDDLISAAFHKAILAGLFIYLYGKGVELALIAKYLRKVRLSIFAINIMSNTTSSGKNNQLKGNSLIFYSK